jgi:hypothetical protein
LVRFSATLGLLLATEMTRDVFNEMSDPPWFIQWEGQKCFFLEKLNHFNSNATEVAYIFFFFFFAMAYKGIH